MTTLEEIEQAVLEESKTQQRFWETHAIASGRVSLQELLEKEAENRSG